MGSEPCVAFFRKPLMTVEDAVKLREKWQKIYKGRACQHKQLVNSLKSNEGKSLDVWICMECGKILENFQS